MIRTSVIVAAGAALLLALAATSVAFAHVSVDPDVAPVGSWALINVKVPNESATAVTNKVELSLPTDTPILNVSYVPVAGWTTELVREALPAPVKVGDNTITEAITTVIWTATPGHEISAGQLQVFPLSLGPIPDTGKLVLTAVQTYSDGSVVSWADATEGAKHPAPVIYVNDAPVGDHSDTVTEDNTASASSDTIARGLGIGGLVVGAIGVAVAIAALRRKAA
ncbi:MAG: YcnI family protein [Terrimesophilobacter sp.]